MKIVPLKCPECNADITIDEDREFGFCSFCGTKIMVETVQRTSTKIDHSDEVANLVLRMSEFYRNDDFYTTE